MDPGAFLGAFSIVCFLVAVLTAVYLRGTKILQITDYQVGLRFRKGDTYTVLSPGCYRTGAGLSPITVVDLRPRQFILERITFQDALRAPSIISVGGELMIGDPQTAINSLKNLLDDSLPIIRDQLGPAVSRSVVSATDESRKVLARAITSEINRALQPFGVLIRNLEITELWTKPVKYAISSEAN